ncbi:MAG: flagellar protein FlgN [Methylococcaceae bacterium]|nr:flagellar protein FlgN [Methylococcaceae bacterium]
MINKTYPITEKLLNNGLDLSLTLLDLLTKEADNLKQNADSTSISNIANHKKETVSQLEQFSKQLSQVLATEKLLLSPNGIADYFKKAETANLNTSTSTRLWTKIISLSKQCRLLNEKNGASINLLAQHTQRALHILKGKSQQATTYGPDGSTYSERFSHSLVSV